MSALFHSYLCGRLAAEWTINMENLYVKRGDIWQASLEELPGCVIHGARPVIVISNDTANRFATIVTVIPLTTSRKKKLPCHVAVKGYGLERDSVALTEQVMTISKDHLRGKIGSLSGSAELRQIERAFLRQMDVA